MMIHELKLIKMEKYNKMEALKYLVDNSEYSDEWSGAGMYTALAEVILSDDEEFDKEYLDGLLEMAADF